VTCTYVNERARSGPLSLNKETAGGVGGPFQFRVDVPDGQLLEYTVTTDTENTPTVVVSVPSGPQGRYTVTETLPPPSAAGTWSVDRVECTPTQVEQSSDRTVVVVDIPPGDAPGTCTYHNRFTPGGKIVINKQTLGGFGTTYFEVEPSRNPQAPGTALPVAQFTRARLRAETTQAGQTVTAIPVEGSLENIPLGDYVVTEILPTSPGGTWSFQSVTCDPLVPLRAEGFSEIITLTPERPQVTCTVVNAFTPAPPPVSPVLECVIDRGTSVTGNRYTAVFGYSNPNSTIVSVEVGPQNRFTPGDPNRGQPTSFDPGRKVAAFRVDFDGSDLVWSLRGRTATAASGSQRCATPTATATPTSTETATPTATVTIGPGTPSPTPGPSSTPTPGPSNTPGPDASATPAGTPTATASGTPTGGPTATASATAGPGTPSPTAPATATATSTGGGGDGGGGGGATSTPTPTLTPVPTASATDTPVLPVPVPPEPSEGPETPVPPGPPLVPGTPTPPPTGVLPGPPVPTVPIQTAVVIQTAVAQGTPFPPAVQTQVASTPGPVQPGLPGTGTGAGGAAGAAGAGSGSGAAGAALLAALGALGILFRRARRR
jgi:hypothetical protein